MRCRNCGWDNAGGNLKCEKCNAQLTEYANERTPRYEYASDEYNPRVTVAGNSVPDNPRSNVAGSAEDEYNPRVTVAGSSVPDNPHGNVEGSDFNPRATVVGCASCGYPVRPDDTECPVCGQAVSGNKKGITGNKEVFQVGTIIQGASFDKEKTDGVRKKLTCFLVTYSLSPNGDYFPLYEGKNMIGRALSSNVRIQDDSAISEKHFSILYRAVDRKFKFKDEQSSNGTFINDELLDEGELKNFDRIRIGTTQLLFIEIPLP